MTTTGDDGRDHQHTLRHQLTTAEHQLADERAQCAQLKATIAGMTSGAPADMAVALCGGGPNRDPVALRRVDVWIGADQATLVIRPLGHPVTPAQIAATWQTVHAIVAGEIAAHDRHHAGVPTVHGTPLPDGIIAIRCDRQGTALRLGDPAQLPADVRRRARRILATPRSARGLLAAGAISTMVAAVKRLADVPAAATGAVAAPAASTLTAVGLLVTPIPAVPPGGTPTPAADQAHAHVATARPGHQAARRPSAMNKDHPGRPAGPLGADKHPRPSPTAAAAQPAPSRPAVASPSSIPTLPPTTATDSGPAQTPPALLCR